MKSTFALIFVGLMVSVLGCDNLQVEEKGIVSASVEQTEIDTLPEDRGPSAEEHRYRKGLGRRAMVFAQCDTNRDGQVTKQEVEAWFTEKFIVADKDSDGFLVADDIPSLMVFLRPAKPKVGKEASEGNGVKALADRKDAKGFVFGKREERWGPDRDGIGRVGGPLKRLDKNGDGKLSLKEFVSGYVTLFGELDKQSEGAIAVANLEQLGESSGFRGDGGGTEEGGKARGAGMRALWEKLDTNKDSKIAKDEVAVFHNERFKQLDTNNNGSIDAKEMTNARPPHGSLDGALSTVDKAQVRAEHRGPEGHLGIGPDGKADGKRKGHGRRMLAMMDANQDNVITAQEHAAFHEKRFDEKDIDKDGFLTLEEWNKCPARNELRGEAGDLKVPR